MIPSDEEPWVVTQGLLVAAEAVAVLQAAAVGCLGKLMPTLTKTLAATSAEAASMPGSASDTPAAAAAATTQLLATLTALHKVVISFCFPQFKSETDE